MAIKVGEGTTLAFGTSSVSLALTSVGLTGMSRGAVDTSHLGSTVWKTFIPEALTDPGGLDCEGLLDGALTAPVGTAFTTASETITVTFADGTGFSFSGFMDGFSTSTGMGAANTWSGTVKATGAITWDTTTA